MPKHVWVDPFAGQGGAAFRSGRGVGADALRDGVAAEPSAGPGAAGRRVAQPVR